MKTKVKFPKGATHARLTTPEGKHTVVTKKNVDTLDGVEGKIDFGKLDKSKHFEVTEVPAPKGPRGGLYAEAQAAAKPAKSPKPAKEKKEKKPSKRAAKASNGEVGKCEFIDALYLEGGHTKKEILELAMKKFPEEKEAKMWSNVRVRPHHIRKAGKKPKWVKEKRAAATA